MMENEIMADELRKKFVKKANYLLSDEDDELFVQVVAEGLAKLNIEIKELKKENEKLLKSPLRWSVGTLTEEEYVETSKEISEKPKDYLFLWVKDHLKVYHEAEAEVKQLRDEVKIEKESKLIAMRRWEFHLKRGDELTSRIEVLEGALTLVFNLLETNQDDAGWYLKGHYNVMNNALKPKGNTEVGE